MADSTPAPETTAAADPNPVSQQPESDADPYIRIHLPQHSSNFPTLTPVGSAAVSFNSSSAPDPTFLPASRAAAFCASRGRHSAIRPCHVSSSWGPATGSGNGLGSRSWEWPAATGSGGLGAPGDAAAVCCAGSAYEICATDAKWLSCYASASSPRDAFSCFSGLRFLKQTMLTVECSYASVIQGVPCYPSPYAPMIRPAFPPRPLVGVMPPLARPPLVGVRPPIIPPVVRPPSTPTVTSAEPQTTVYVGKISSTVENDFMLSLLQLCGPVKSWKRPQDPTGTLKGFGFCEFESAEGVLRALRLLNKLSVDGQELMIGF
ncbi:hypothetical protein Sango_1020800 [Sesamum angolense]|uniref:RRM domain-containing protein n=1 Tax=Sesamum angolense TaxID=2727404 RepID=A0AAE2BYV8_9LAMI|nr:hypothetical protein Sango_1020800 [Sesamum angolense]